MSSSGGSSDFRRFVLELMKPKCMRSSQTADPWTWAIPEVRQTKQNKFFFWGGLSL